MPIFGERKLKLLVFSDSLKTCIFKILLNVNRSLKILLIGPLTF